MRYIIISTMVTVFMSYAGCQQNDLWDLATQSESSQSSIEMSSVPGGVNFNMGFAAVAIPVHTVASISSFRMSRYEISYAVWVEVKSWGDSHGYVFSNPGVMGDGSGDSERHPVTYISFRDAIVWCNALSSKEGKTPLYCTTSSLSTEYKNATNTGTGLDNVGYIANDCVRWSENGYRLPTEAEWEYASRYIDGSSWVGGNLHSGANIDGVVDNCAWYDINSFASTHIVGTRTPNSLGLYDVSGNVHEFCWDWEGSYTTSSPYTDANTRGPSSGTNRMIRGGSFGNTSTAISTSYRPSGVPPAFKDYNVGFRVVRN